MKTAGGSDKLFCLMFSLIKDIAAWKLFLTEEPAADSNPFSKIKPCSASLL